MNIILGDNPFFGVNHKSGSKKLDSSTQRFTNAADIVRLAVKNDISNLMISPHPNYDELLSLINTSLLKDNSNINLSLVLPYPHTINNIIAESGYFGLFKLLPLKSYISGIFSLVRYVFGNTVPLFSVGFKSIINIELARIKNYPSLNVSHICLHNVITDLLIANGRFDVINAFLEAVYSFGFKPVLISQNPSSVMSLSLNQKAIKCFTYNINSYMVNPNISTVRNSISNYDKSQGELWAMQILASGAINPTEALKDPFLSHFDSILYATTKPERLIDFISKKQDYPN